MIVTFSVSNFRSFADEQTFSFVASEQLSGVHADHLVQLPGRTEKILRAAILYGANGAGKSNLISALRYMQSMTQERPREGATGRVPFAFGDWPTRPSTFDLQFFNGTTLYRYGFQVDARHVLDEWLYEVRHPEQQIVFERRTAPDGQVTVELGPDVKSNLLKALAEVGGPPNQTFLATARLNLNPLHMTAPFHDVNYWFQKLTLTGPDQRIVPSTSYLGGDTNLADLAGEFLRYASTGVQRLIATQREVSGEQAKQLFPDALARRFTGDINATGTETARFQLSPDRELLVERSGDGSRYFLVTLQAAHEHPGGSVNFNLSDESDGTRRLLELVPALHEMQSHGGVFVIDEIDRSLHPMLVWKFVEFFLRTCHDDHRQLLVTTHESNLLDLDLLRRDEIWFAEKDLSLATHLYSLSDFKPRADEKLRQHYFEGRFGAIPFLGGLDRLIQTTNGESGKEPHPA